MVLPGLTSFGLGEGALAGMSPSSGATSGPVSVNTGGIHFAPKPSAAASLIDPHTLLIVGAIVAGVVLLKRKG